MPLSTEEKILIEQRITNEKKSVGVAYLLLIFLGWLGAHRFYLGVTGTAVTQLLLFVLGVLTAVIVIGGFLLIALAIWLFIDLFLIPGIVRNQDEALRSRLTSQAIADSHS